jgi:hypothetical protein
MLVQFKKNKRKFAITYLHIYKTLYKSIEGIHLYKFTFNYFCFILHIFHHSNCIYVSGSDNKSILKLFAFCKVVCIIVKAGSHIGQPFGFYITCKAKEKIHHKQLQLLQVCVSVSNLEIGMQP